MNKQLVLSVSGMQLMDKLELHTGDRENQLLEGQNTADDDQICQSACALLLTLVLLPLIQDEVLLTCGLSATSRTRCYYYVYQIELSLPSRQTS
jgi:hypothetical protein